MWGALVRSVASLLVAALSATLVACGGGGGGGSTPGNPPSSNGGLGKFSASFSTPSADVSGIEGSTATTSLTATLAYDGSSNVFLAADVDPALVLDIQGQIVGNTLNLQLTMRGDVAAGNHASELLLYACADENCSQQPEGSPVHLPLHYAVKPNIAVQQSVQLSRSGQEPAPQITLPVTVPTEAGAVAVHVSGPSAVDQLDVAFDGSSLQLGTRQLHAGTYSWTVSLQSASDERYARTVTVTYTVAAPPGGEQPMTVTSNTPRPLWLRQGSRSVQQIHVSRPTWTSAWTAPQIVGDPSHLLSLVDLGGGDYEVTIDTTGVALGSYGPSIKFQADDSAGGTAYAGFDIGIAFAFYVEGSLGGQVTATSTAADLQWSAMVRTFDGSSAQWSAVSLSPYLQVLSGTGQTGVDALRVALDPAALALPDWGLALGLQVSIDQPGVLPYTINVSVYNSLPELRTLSPAVLDGSSGRIYIDGALQSFGTGLLESNRLHVSGATLAKAQFISDPRMAGDMPVLALDLTGATPGTPVQISADATLRPTQLTLQVTAPLVSAASYQALPFAAYRPAQFASGLDSLYFASPGIAYRWSYQGGAWSLSQASVPGLIDVAPAPDGSSLFGIDATSLLALDPLTLALRSAGALHSPYFSALWLDPAAPSSMRALAFAADGRALASVTEATPNGSHGVEWICTKRDDRSIPALASSPEPCDPGNPMLMSGSSIGAGLVRSTHGHATVGIGPGGERVTYLPTQRLWSPGTKLPAGLSLAAVADSGTRAVRSDGMLLDTGDTQIGNLGSLVPFTHVAGGYGLSSSGRYGFVYGYRISGSGAAQRADDAKLWVVDLANAVSNGVAAAPVIAEIALAQPVGCTVAPVTGEACQHAASIALAPGEGTAFVLGPRGVAALPLPAAVAALSVSPRSPTTQRAPIRLPLRGTVRAGAE